MIAGYAVAEGKLRALPDLLMEKDAAVWVDLLRPSREEEIAVESALAIEAPTREEMDEIEVSSRLYTDGDASYMTAMILSNADQGEPVIAPVTFVLSGGRLLTIRYEEPKVFASFPSRAQKSALGCISAETIFVGLLEAVIDRLADVLEHAASDIDKISHAVFAMRGAKPSRSRDFQRVIVDLGRKGDVASKIRESLITLSRLFGFYALHSNEAKTDKDLKARIKSLTRDAGSLTDHVSYMSQKITFLLDATLGMINIEQNAIIKIFSVAAVCFLPPTLIASVYGMNFENMPELASPIGYPIILVAMLLSAALPLAYFKARGWL